MPAYLALCSCTQRVPAGADEPRYRLICQPPATAREAKERPASSYVATASRDKSIKLWDAATGTCIRTLTGHDNWVRALVFHPNGKFLLSASDDKTVRIWELATGRCSKTIEAHAHFVTCMSWGRTTIAGPAQNGATSTIGQDGQAQVQMQMQATQPERRLVNVLATGSVDQVGLVRMWRATPLRLESWLMVGRLLDHQDLASVIAPLGALSLRLGLGQPLGAKHRSITVVLARMPIEVVLACMPCRPYLRSFSAQHLTADALHITALVAALHSFPFHSKLMVLC